MTPIAVQLPRYQNLRQLATALNTRLVETLPKAVLHEGGKQLGILKDNTLLLDSEDMICVLMDFCIYNVRRQGMNAVERYLAESPPPEDSDEMTILKAMKAARYTLFVVEGIERGVGITIRDLLRDESRFLVDVNFSRTVQVGLFLAGRIYAPDGISMTTGAVLPIGLFPKVKQDQFLHKMMGKMRVNNFRDLSPGEESTLAATTIRSCLAQGAAEKIEYRSSQRSKRMEPTWSQPARAPHIGRNDRCPCGSGKKFKQCCGARR